VERLLSGEIDPSDPNSVRRALNDPNLLSPVELAEVKALAEAKLAAGNIEGVDLPPGSELEGGDLKEGRSLAGAGTTGKNAKTDEKDPSKTTNPGLAGIAIRLINREVMGFKLADLMGKRKDAKAVSLNGDPKAALDPKGKGALKKKLTAVDYYRLRDNGITAPRHGNNIFKMAHRQFRDFSKWRSVPAGRVAFAR
jgi:hypothetical protein